MIIKYPTGLYAKDLPQFIASTNITYNISYNAPQRSSLLFTQMPVGERERLQEIKLESRDKIGDLVYTVSSSNGLNTQYGQKTYSIGDVLEFQDVPINTDQYYETDKSTEIMHNLYYIDYQRLGLTNADITRINESVKTRFEEITVQLNAAKEQRVNIQTEIDTVKKTNNEATKALNALGMLTGFDDMITKLLDEINANNAYLSDLKSNLDVILLEITRLTDELRTMGALLK